MAVTYNKYDCFVFHLGSGLHDLANDQIHWILGNTAPNNATHTMRSDFVPLANANGYNQVQLSGSNWTQATNISKFACNNNQVWTAAGNFGPFRYLGMVNANSDANANNCLMISWWDYASSINCNNGESFTVAVPANKLIFSIT